MSRVTSWVGIASQTQAHSRSDPMRGRLPNGTRSQADNPVGHRCRAARMGTSAPRVGRRLFRENQALRELSRSTNDATIKTHESISHRNLFRPDLPLVLHRSAALGTSSPNRGAQRTAEPCLAALSTQSRPAEIRLGSKGLPDGEIWQLGAIPGDGSTGNRNR